jgi:hypothetical protein
MAENVQAKIRERRLDDFMLLLSRFVDVSLELERAWPSGDDFELTVEGYPDYLPSFDQLPHDLMAWHDAVNDAVVRARRDRAERDVRGGHDCAHVATADDGACLVCHEPVENKS